MRLLTKFIQNFFSLFGLIVKRKKNHYDSKKNFFQSLKYNKINSLIDVGAHEGNFIIDILKKIPNMKVISFEPVNSSFNILNKNSEKYNNWKTYPYALGNIDQKTEINISDYSEANSFLTITNELINFRPELKIKDKEVIQCKKLDNFFDEIKVYEKPIMLKIDTQGYDLEVLKGAKETLKIIDFLFIEASTAKVYENQPLFSDIINFVEKENFKVWSVDRLMGNRKTGQTFQVDILFSKSFVD